MANRLRALRAALSERARSSLANAAQTFTGTLACALWIALAMPSLQLLPGLGGLGQDSVAISLQSALLGIGESWAGDSQGGNSAFEVNPSLRLLTAERMRLGHSLGISPPALA